MEFLQRIKSSMINFSSYNDIVNNSWKKSFKYFLGLLSILFLITMTPMITDFMGDVKILRQAAKEMPEFTLENGIFNAETNEPTFYDLDDGLLIIDEQESVNRQTITGYESFVVITRDSMYVITNGEESVLEFADFKHITLTKDSLLTWASLLYLVGLGVLLFGLLILVSEKLLFSLVLALMGRMINRFFRQKHSLMQLWNIALYALTLPLILDTAYKLWFTEFPNFQLLYWGTAIFYMYWALAELKKKSTTTK